MAGRSADVRSDIYSFGATLYFALSGKLPFPDVRGEALFDAHRNRVAPPLSSAAPAPISPELERVIERCMAKNPAERYSSAQALYDELRSIEA
jgi:serine/threonine protein kinase